MDLNKHKHDSEEFFRIGHNLTPIERFDSNHGYFRHKLDILRKINDEILPQAIVTQMGAHRIDVIVHVGGKEGKENENFVEIIKDSKKKSFRAKDKKLLKEMREMIGSEMISDNISKFIREMSLVYLIIAFEEYLSSILKEVFSSKREILKESGTNISFAEAFPYKDMESLLNALIDKKVSSLFSHYLTKYSRSYLLLYLLQLR